MSVAEDDDLIRSPTNNYYCQKETCYDVVFAVTGAGSEKANGFYFPTEEYFDDVQVYSKSGHFKDRDEDDFLIFRCNGNQWSISTLRKGGRLEDDDEDDYYWNNSKTEGNNQVTESALIITPPPEFNWMINEEGIEPAPRVSRVYFKVEEPDVISKKMETMLFSKTLSDVQFHCASSSSSSSSSTSNENDDGDRIVVLYAHKVILAAASPYFATVFEGPWGDKHKDGVWKTSNSASLMRLILTYLYTGERNLPELSKYPLEILALAHEYQLVGLVNAAETFLIQRIQFDNIQELLHTASLYNLKCLKQSCFAFIQENAMNILLEQESFRMTFENNKSLLTELKHFVLGDDEGMNEN